MNEWDVAKFVGGMLTGVLSFFGLCAWVFPTKEQVSKDCHTCRSEIYNTLKNKASADDMKRLESKVDNLAPQINTINEHIVELKTIINIKLGDQK